ncbi:MAG: prepilin-type N-terminal cleavage/methylation domain-containing protein [Phycisphaerales bacterium]
MSPSRKRANRAFSLIELIIVVVIIGIIAAIAIPRMSRGAAGAADSSLSGSLAVMRSGLDIYATEHGGTFPVLATFAGQMTLFTDYNGATNATKVAPFIYGPYLRKIPPLAVGTERGSIGITNIPGTAGAGWVYDDVSGTIVANTTVEADVSGKLYNTY